ncbi:MAG: hypothetical protein ABR527_12195 [Gemmatimonadota bacterium]
MTSIDLVPRTTCPSSNQGEYYYSIAPDPEGTLGTMLSTSDAFELERLLIAHETTHVIQFGRRAAFPGATGHLARWQAEGQAMLAEELVSFHLRGRTTGANYGPEVLFDENPQAWHARSFDDLFGDYGFRTPTLRVTGAPEQCSFLGVPDEGNKGPCIGNMAYGVSWALFRWLSDQFGPALGGEAAMHQAIIENANTGLPRSRASYPAPIPASPGRAGTWQRSRNRWLRRRDSRPGPADSRPSTKRSSSAPARPPTTWWKGLGRPRRFACAR